MWWVYECQMYAGGEVTFSICAYQYWPNRHRAALIEPRLFALPVNNTTVYRKVARPFLISSGRQYAWVIRMK